MQKKLIPHLVVALVLFGLAIGFNNWCKSINPVGRYAEEVENYLRIQEKKASKLLAEEVDFFETQINAGDSKANLSISHAEKFSAIASNLFTICLVKHDSLVFWTNNQAVPTTAMLAKWQKSTEFPCFQTLPSGTYEVTRQPYKSMTAYTLIPVRYSFAAQDFVTTQAFPSTSSMPRGVDLSEKPTNFSIKSKDGQALGFLTSTESIEYAPYLNIKFWLFLAALIAFFSVVNTVSRMLAERYQAAIGAMVLIPVVGGVIFLNQKLDFTARFKGMDLFARTVVTPFLSNSVGDMLINIGILLWLMVFFHRHFQVRGYRNLPLPLRFAVSTGNYMSVVVSTLISAWILRELVFKSNIGFDFSNVFNLDRYSVMAIIGVIFLLGAMFLFSHRMVMSVFSAALSRTQRTGAAVLAVAIAAPIMIAFKADLDVDSWKMVSFALTYCMAFDYFVEQKNNKWPWVIAWLFVFAWFATILLFKYNELKDVQIRKEYSTALVDDRDSLAEIELCEIRNELLMSDHFKNTLAPYRFQTGSDSLVQFVNLFFNKKRYIFQHYRFDLNAFDSDQIVALDSQSIVSKQLMDEMWDKSTPVMDENLRISHDTSGKPTYLMRMKIAPHGDENHPASLYFVVNRQHRIPTNVFTQLFFSQPFKNLKFLPRFQYMIYRNDKRIEEVGKLSEFVLEPTFRPQVADSIYTFFSPDQAQKVVAQVSKNKRTVVALGHDNGGWLKQMYLFSAIFATLSVFMVLLAGINSLTHILPDNFKFYLSPRGSLSRRIQFWMGTVIICSFAMIAWLTFSNFNNSSKDNIKEQLNSRTNSMITTITNIVVDWSSMSGKSMDLLKKQIDPIAKLYMTDLNIYNLSGNLIYSSQPELVQIGAVNHAMSLEALNVLKTERKNEKIEEEQTGSYHYNTAYLPIREGRNDAKAFISVPYYVKDSGIRSDVSDFIGKLLALYVLLILAAGIIGTEVSRSIAKPITELGTVMTEMKLEEKNEPVFIKGQNDLEELKNLVGEFNRMIFKIEESKELLARSEREGAWRKMARQVAHEIRNPLTTMKLSMQQLERSVRMAPQDFEANLKKTTNRLITQIDNLAQIAGDFSLYAEINQPPKHDIVINDILESVCDLFSEHENATLTLHQPVEKYHVLGGSSHLTRVFNNLILNALQAVPYGAHGEIEVSIYEKDNMSVVKIADNGGGVPIEIRHQIFEPNFTTKSSGTGLGLPICKSIIDALDGSLYFTVRENLGTDFFIELPIIYVENEVEMAV
jgi:two-component system, NtrC family, nitrogen regulation sensor histidine kinase NtrY